VTSDPEERIEEIEAALEEDPVDLATGSSVESIRSSSGSGLATLPYLTINDIVALRDADMTELEQIEENVLEVPEVAWDHVVHMVRARVLQVSPSDLRTEIEG
jgi:hypothetical protein